MGVIRAGLGGLLLGLGVALWAYFHGQAVCESRHLEAYAQAQAENIMKQKKLVADVVRAAEIANEEQVNLERRVALADSAVLRLQQEVRDANSRDDSTAPAALDAARARSLLADCAGRYRDVAKQADHLRALVIGLQEYARAVSK